MGMDHAYSRIELSEVGVIIPEPVTFEEAVKLFKMRVPMTKKEWQELEAKLRFRAFTVARLTELDSVEAVRKRVIKAIEEGKTLRQFWEEAGRDELLRRAGFHRGDPWYWETVFRTNIQTAYNAGRAYEFKRNPPAYLEFVGIMDTRQTPICRARSGVIRRADDPFWSTNWPPLHHNCRSTIRAVHKEEAEAFGLKETTGLPEDKPAKGFGLNPLESGSFWKMTDSMAERAKRYGIMDEIEEVGEKLGVKKEKRMPSLFDELQEIDFKDESSIEKIMKAISERKKEWFKEGFTGIEITNKVQIMATQSRRGILLMSPKAVDLKLGGDTIRWSIKQELLQAFRKLKEGKDLMISEEAALQALWHEILHFRAERPFIIKPPQDSLYFMETLNEFVARHTYDELLKLFGTKPRFKAELIKNGVGYQQYVEKFIELNRYLRLELEDVEKVLLSDYNGLRRNLSKIIAEKHNLTEGQRVQLYEIFDLILSKKVFIDEFKKKIKEYKWLIQLRKSGRA